MVEALQAASSCLNARAQGSSMLTCQAFCQCLLYCRLRPFRPSVESISSLFELVLLARCDGRLSKPTLGRNDSGNSSFDFRSWTTSPVRHQASQFHPPTLSPLPHKPALVPVVYLSTRRSVYQYTKTFITTRSSFIEVQAFLSSRRRDVCGA